MNKKNLAFLFLIAFSSLFIRLYQLGSVPNGLTVDEADMAYNAYSILKTGKDVYNRSFPLFFQSLDDYKPPFPIYSTIPSIYFLGLSEFSIRLTPAILGALTPLLALFLFKIIYPSTKKSAQIAALLFTFAPWSIAISRATFMYIELVFFYLLFLLTFTLGIKRNSNWLIFSGVILGFTLYTYYAAIIYLPLILLIVTAIFFKDLKKISKKAVLALLILILVSLPALIHYTSLESRSRLDAISVFTPDITLPLSIEETEKDREANLPFSSITHNRRMVFVNSFLNNYFDYFNFDYLFVNSNYVRYFYTNWVGLFYIIELPLFLFGIYHLLSSRTKEGTLFLSFLLIGPIPAAITLGTQFPHRAILLILSIQIITVIGGFKILELIPKKYSNSTVVFFLLYLVSVNFFFHQYLFHSRYEFTPVNYTGTWFSPMKDVLKALSVIDTNNKKVVFTWSEKSVPAIYYLFYNQVDPRIIQKKSSKWKNEPPSFRQIYDQVENFSFRPINWKREPDNPDAIYVIFENEIPPFPYEILSQTYTSKGERLFLIIKRASI